ncbi:hypothetical protein E9531_08645 [Lampropedia puyangensis]|uniref:Uncharacterized protein n=1 Tax=Lampropedia puyangensis TaxID=1330072 RepID=A0A4S8F5F5_9BURK|nr:hypothetical protein [Lampropedia puyangensis]THU02051.1 hypothetical protein E9531_08645 [Lampropedia puyangensis]
MTTSNLILQLKTYCSEYCHHHATTAGLLLIASAWLAGCSNTPPTPVWQIQSSSALMAAQSAYLDGDQRIATLELNKARTQISRTADPLQLARLELHQCALQVASLDWQTCDAFTPLAASATAAERNYAAYLQGLSLTAEAQQQLPPAQQAIAGLNRIDAQSLQTLQSIKDPLSRLVATATLSRRAQNSTPELMTLAIDTASQAGWRRPLLAWLLLQQQWAQAQHMPALAESTRLRIQILQSQGNPLAEPTTSHQRSSAAP